MKKHLKNLKNKNQQWSFFIAIPRNFCEICKSIVFYQNLTFTDGQKDLSFAAAFCGDACLL